MIAYRFTDNGQGILNNTREKFKVFKNNMRYWYADPILYKTDNKIYMFYEAYNKKTKRGEIGVATFINKKLVDQRIVIKEPFHMSYPFVFELGNKIYMIPETSSVKKLLLYEATEFPFKWKISKVLLENKELADSTIFNYENNIYLFVSKLLSTSPYQDELQLFSVNKDFDLRPHSCNPIVTDNEFTRPAGRVLSFNQKLIRVSQDCSYGEYGKALKFNEILSITEHSYKEKNILSLQPGDIPIQFHKKLTGTHTYGKCEDLEVIDVKFSVFDFKKLFTFCYRLPFKSALKIKAVIKRSSQIG